MPSGSSTRISTSKVEIKEADDTVSTSLVGTLVWSEKQPHKTQKLSNPHCLLVTEP